MTGKGKEYEMLTRGQAEPKCKNKCEKGGHAHAH